MRRVSLTYKNVDEFIVIVIIKMRLSRRLSIFLVVEIFKRHRILQIYEVDSFDFA